MKRAVIAHDSMLAEFLKAVEDLSTWQHFPDACAWPSLAIKLAEWSEGRIERARLLVANKNMFREYPGPATLKKFFDRTFESSATSAVQ